MKLIQTLKFKMIISILSVFLIFFLLLFYDNIYTKSYVKKQLIASEQVVASLYMEKIDTILKDMESLLLSLTTGWINDGTLNFSTQDNIILACSKMQFQMSTQIAANNEIQFFYIYFPASDDFIYTTGLNFNRRNADAVRTQLTVDTFSYNTSPITKLSSWKPITIQNNSYIYQSCTYQDCCIGLLIDIDKIFNSDDIYNYSQAQSKPVFSTLTGTAMNEREYVQTNKIMLSWDFSDYYITGQNNSTIITGVSSKYGDFGLMLLIPNDSNIFSNLFVQNFLVLSFCGIFIYTVVILLLLKRYTLTPLTKLRQAMVKVQEGSLDIQITEQATSEDFKHLNESFNQMIQQLKSLKIEAYEKKLYLKNIEMEQLRMQINPHLFLNSLNLILNLALENSPSFCEAILSLIEVFRYFVRQHDPLVTLKQELQYTASYRKIQELNYPGRIVFTRNIPFYLESLYVPTMTFLEFVENAIKYALPFQEQLEISLTATLEDIEDKSFLFIEITDNGPGYDEAILSMLSKHSPIIDNHGKQHIGIQNYIKRIKYIYDDAAQISFSNATCGGARVCIKLPVIENRNWTVHNKS